MKQIQLSRIRQKKVKENPNYAIVKLIEEMGELHQALAKHIIDDPDANVEEEIAHVKVFLGLVEKLFDKQKIQEYWVKRYARVLIKYNNHD